ncbi:hypothetical protein ACGF3C_19600 [Micromonospora sp. NPDC047762]|uniref:hypothetical protein n=1 Tax=Micromonospora sp. NPDC047762 TaxID=3364255 RepID=UPI0037146551
MAVLHEGFPETATASAVRAVTALLAEGRAHSGMVTSLVEFLGDAALSVTNLAENPHFAEVLPDVADAVAAAYPVVLPLLRTSIPEHAPLYAENVVAIAQMAPLADQREELAAFIRDWLQRGPVREPCGSVASASSASTSVACSPTLTLRSGCEPR